MQSDTMKPMLDKVAFVPVVWKPLGVIGKAITACSDETPDVITVAILIRLWKKWRPCKKWRVCVVLMRRAFQQQETCDYTCYKGW